MNYYDLPKDDRWLDGDDSPYEIGGRATDVSQIGYSLAGRVRELYPINCVPQALAKRLSDLQVVCDECEREIEKTMALISDFRQPNVKEAK